MRRGNPLTLEAGRFKRESDHPSCRDLKFFFSSCHLSRHTKWTTLRPNGPRDHSQHSRGMIRQRRLLMTAAHCSDDDKSRCLSIINVLSSMPSPRPNGAATPVVPSPATLIFLQFTADHHKVIHLSCLLAALAPATASAKPVVEGQQLATRRSYIYCIRHRVKSKRKHEYSTPSP